MKRILVKTTSGELQFIHPSPRAREAFNGTEDQFLEALASRRVPPGATYRFIDETEYPKQYKFFRKAWRDVGGSVVVDMPVARNIHREHIRRLRVQRLQALDAEWMKAIGTGNTAVAQTIEAQRQVLRDAPSDPAIDAARTPEELNAALPEILK